MNNNQKTKTRKALANIQAYLNGQQKETKRENENERKKTHQQQIQDVKENDQE